MTEKTYTADQVKNMLADSMHTFRSSMIELIAECASHPKYKAMTTEDALNKIVDKLRGLK